MAEDAERVPKRSSPRYLKIAESIRTEIATGQLSVNSRLPTVRDLAAELQVARQTIVDAYRQLAEWGLIESHVGRGTKVVSVLPRAEARLRLEQLLDTGPIADFEAIGATAGIRSMATAVPDPSLFLADELLPHLRAQFDASPWNFYYAPPSGAPELRRQLADLTTADGAEDVRSANVVVTLGAMHAQALVVDELCEVGDTVWVQAPGFLGLPEFFASRRLNSFFFDPERMPSDLPPPRLILLSPSFGAATGHRLSEEHCREVLRFAESKDCYVVEDGHYRRISFEEPAPLLRTLSDNPRLIQIDGLSGCLSPGLRTGWMVADPQFIGRIERRIRNSGAAGIAFLQSTLASYLVERRLEAHLERCIPKYLARRNALLSSLKFDWPADVKFDEPKGGLSVWLKLAEQVDTRKLYAPALSAGSPFAPGPMFGMPPSTMRLSFGTLTPEALHEAGRVLGALVSRATRL